MNKDINNNFEELDDDELDRIAGGVTAASAAEQAAADGRTFQLPAGNFLKGTCICAAHNKWARYRIQATGEIDIDYADVKCYNCGKTWESVKLIY